MAHTRSLTPRTRELVCTALAIRCVRSSTEGEPDACLVARLTRFDLLDLQGFGRARVQEVRAWLAAHGFDLRDGKPPPVFPRGCPALHA